MLYFYLGFLHLKTYSRYKLKCPKKWVNSCGPGSSSPALAMACLSLSCRELPDHGQPSTRLRRALSAPRLQKGLGCWVKEHVFLRKRRRSSFPWDVAVSVVRPEEAAGGAGQPTSACLAQRSAQRCSASKDAAASRSLRFSKAKEIHVPERMKKIWTPKSPRQHPSHPSFPLPEAPWHNSSWSIREVLREQMNLFIPQMFVVLFNKKPFTYARV